MFSNRLWTKNLKQTALLFRLILKEDSNVDDHNRLLSLLSLGVSAVRTI